MSFEFIWCDVISCVVLCHVMQCDVMWCPLMWWAVICCEVMRCNGMGSYEFVVRFGWLWCHVVCGSKWLCDVVNWNMIWWSVLQSTARTTQYYSVLQDTTKYYSVLHSSDTVEEINLGGAAWLEYYSQQLCLDKLRCAKTIGDFI